LYQLVLRARNGAVRVAPTQAGHRAGLAATRG
jgi:hypothetical protein